MAVSMSRPIDCTGAVEETLRDRRRTETSTSSMVCVLATESVCSPAKPGSDKYVINNPAIAVRFVFFTLWVMNEQQSAVPSFLERAKPKSNSRSFAGLLTYPTHRPSQRIVSGYRFDVHTMGSQQRDCSGLSPDSLFILCLELRLRNKTATKLVQT